MVPVLARASRPIRTGNIAARPPHLEMSAMVSSMCNPFSPKSLGCRIPDGNSELVIPAQIRGLTALATNANGALMSIFTTGVPYNQLVGTALTGGHWTFAAAYNSAFQNSVVNSILGVPANNGSLYRPVCGGIIIRCVQSAMNASGTLVISKIPKVPNVASDLVSGNMYGDVKAVPIVAGMEVPVLFKPIGATSSQFIQQNENNQGQPNYWDAISVEVIGGTVGAAVLEIEYVVNVELVPMAGQMAYQWLALKSDTNPIVVAATKKVWSLADSIFTKGVDYASNQLGRLARGAIAGLIGGPVASRLAIAVD